MQLPKPICLPLILAILISGSTSAQSKRQPRTNELLNGTVWMQTALEYEVLCEQAYQLARVKVHEALKDKTWTAATEQKENFAELPPAVILDVDETVLDNSPFQARLVKDNTEFDAKKWLSWCKEEQADVMPGAKAFIEHMNDIEVAVFFVTNREASVEQATVNNLTRTLGFPVTKEQVLCKYETQKWGSDKTTRRKHVAQNHRIVLLLGDDFNDFVYIGKISPANRFAKAKEFRKNFGTKWIQLPNPLYGNWERSIYNYDYKMTRGQILNLKYGLLDTKREPVEKTNGK